MSLSPANLFNDLIVQILVRLPPDEPECLVRASLVCKHWYSLITGHTFIRRYREFHRLPPLLGFLRGEVDEFTSHFVPTTAFRPPESCLLNCHTLDCRHGRVLLRDTDSVDLLLWNPMTGEKMHLREPKVADCYFRAAVLCATAGCDHLGCREGPFLVAFVGIGTDEVAYACLYSSVTDKWSDVTKLQLDYSFTILPMAPVLVGDALHYMCDSGIIFRYDVGSEQCISVFDQLNDYSDENVLMLTEDGGLGLASIDMLTLCLWSLKTGPDEARRWEKLSTINLKMLPNHNPSCLAPSLVGFVQGVDSGIIFMSTHTCILMINLKSERVSKVCEMDDDFEDIFPYFSFCTPGRVIEELPEEST
ncbi:hypothetical protein BRADI_1g58651v3 [Brachypodium distachyon]|uniref:F-box domain-containing protein n=1 Tax=Brachypodium distachyon TaxID=15368 RepID=A0A0Q3HE86_BRADI|nr:hypothetical protein BRADI_1g58651v3 [Brachypodium distachyon]